MLRVCAGTEEVQPNLEPKPELWFVSGRAALAHKQNHCSATAAFLTSVKWNLEYY